MLWMSKSFLGYSPGLHYGSIDVGRRSLKSSLIARVQNMDSRTEAKAVLTSPDNPTAGVLTVDPPQVTYWISQMFCTGKIPHFLNYAREKRVNCDMRLEDVLLYLFYFEQIVSFCATIYSKTNLGQLFCDTSSLNLANFTELVIFRVTSWKFYPSQNNLHKCHLWQIPCLKSQCRRGDLHCYMEGGGVVSSHM